MKSTCLTMAVLISCIAGPLPAFAADDALDWKVGVAAVSITPSQPMWMAG